MSPYRLPDTVPHGSALPDLFPFGTPKSCPKCGASLFVRTQMCRGTYLTCGEKREHFHVRCNAHSDSPFKTNGCGWRALMATKDAGT